jgi:hypothetical protein
MTAFGPLTWAVTCSGPEGLTPVTESGIEGLSVTVNRVGLGFLKIGIDGYYRAGPPTS